MIDMGTKVFTEKGNKPYTIYGASGSFLLLGLEYPYEGCTIDECKLFNTKNELEKFIDENEIKYEYYVASWINCH